MHQKLKVTKSQKSPKVDLDMGVARNRHVLSTGSIENSGITKSDPVKSSEDNVSNLKGSNTSNCFEIQNIGGTRIFY